jgi:hypothetical protein
MDLMNLAELLKSLAAQIAELQGKLVDAEAAAASIAKENYDKGFIDGVASVPAAPEDTTPFSQMDLDAAVAAAIEPMAMEIAMLKEKVAMLEVEIQEAAAKAVAAFKMELMSKYEAQQVAETEGETGFKEMLK